MSFKQALAAGQLGESLIARWQRRQGCSVLPAYDKENNDFKGPRLFMAEGAPVAQLIAPDMLVMGQGKFLWIEAKHKSRFTWYAKNRRFTTGIDLRHYKDYCAVEAETGLPVWLMFLHTEGTTSPDEIKRYGAPPTCPTGLFGNQVGVLQAMEPDHISHEFGAGGMIFWHLGQLDKLATLEEVYGTEPIPANPAVQRSWNALAGRHVTTLYSN